MKIGCKRTAVLDLRPLFILTVALTLIGCSGGPNLQPTTSRSSDPVRLEFAGERWDAYGNFLTALKLTNRSDGDISYPGYSTASPAYTQQVRGADWEGWRDNNGGWCGVGLGMQKLGPGQSITFTVPASEDSPSWRVGIGIAKPDARTIWTAPIISSKKSARKASSAARLVQMDVVKHPERDFPYAFTLKNISDKPVYYGGYQEPDVPPIYLGQENRQGGCDDEGHVDWCGTGFGFKALRPGSSISFSIPAQSLNSNWRIGIQLYKSAQPASRDDAFSPVWWGSLPPRD